MTTMYALRSRGCVAVLFTLALVVAVALLRLTALPLAGAVLVLDIAADAAARPLTLPGPAREEDT